MIVLGESCVAFVLRWSSPESNINSWPPSTFPLFSQDTCGDDDDNCDDDEKTETDDMSTIDMIQCNVWNAYLQWKMTTT